VWLCVCVGRRAIALRPQHAPPVEACWSSTNCSSCTGKRHSLTTGRCISEPAAVRIVTTRIVPSLPGCVLITTPNFHFVGWELSSFIITTLPFLKVRFTDVHFPRIWHWGKYSLCHLFQKVWVRNWTYFQRRRLLGFSCDMSGSGGKVTGPPIKKWAGVKLLLQSLEIWRIAVQWWNRARIHTSFYLKE